jgi:hypothetical protein
VSDTPRPAVPAGWNASFPENLPKPTTSPVLFAFGAMLIGWGLISSALLDVVGGAVLLYALVHWVREIVHDAAE